MKWIIALIILLLGGFLWWSFSPLLFDTEVKDELDATLRARLEAQRQVDANRQKQSEETTSQETEKTPVASEINIDTETGVISRGPFSITGTTGHRASGAIEIIESPEEKLVYYKDYNGTNGPDLKIYLSKDLEAKEYINLGDAKGNVGDLIYGVPLDVDFSQYKYVLTWCEAFGVLFDYAQIK